MTEHEIRFIKLSRFEKAKGKQFKLIYTPPNAEPLVDEVKGIDWNYQHVCGKKYGNFHVDYVELIEG